MPPTVTIDRSVATLQDLCLSAEPSVCRLYWRIEGGRIEPRTNYLGPLKQGQTVLFDTFVNSLYETYWRELTTVEHISFEMVTSGDCVIRLVRRRNEQPETIHARSVSGVKRLTILHVPHGATSRGVLHIEVDVCSEDVTIHEGRWTTVDPPKNDVSLAIAICSFGRDDMVAASWTRIASLVESSDKIRRVFIVHQGQSDLARHPAIIAANSDAHASKLQILRQDNFGGSGGFARGILEALHSAASAILLMDDDIRVEPFVLARLSVLLAYLRAPVVIGGQMLDLDNPMVLWASHEKVDYPRLALVNAFKGIDLSEASPASLFWKRHHSAYNAWWFCSIPTTELERVGLPLPLFIRHDDVELGVRMTRAGRRIVTMPGLFVWHRAHETKSKPWLTYYEHRNFLINAALHGRLSSVRAGTLMAAQAWAGLSRHRYDYCWTVCEAVEDYLRGPSVVFADPRARHRQIVADAARYTLQAVKLHRARESVSTLPPGKSGGRKRNLDLLRWLFHPGSRSRLARQLAWRIARMVFRLLAYGPAAGAAYRASAERYSSVSFWRRYLGLSQTSGVLDAKDR